MTKIVVALGGNALGNSPEEQLELVKGTAKSLVSLIKAGHEVVISHGNGPQVGAINLGMNYAAENGQGAAFPFPECGAMSQGYIGYHLQQSLLNEIGKEGITKEVATLVTQIEVDPKDSAFQNLTKPIGSFYDKETSEKIATEKGYTFVEDAGRGYRRVVASPQPIEILELASIKALIEAGTLVIAGGGGGVPVIKDSSGTYQGVAAVIDKDQSSALLAGKLEADQLIILTAVEHVYIHYGKENQEKLTQVKTGDLIDYVKHGEFAKGSMLPKIMACLSFLDHNPNGKAIITSLDSLEKALNGVTGTHITK
ncbi:carbamate kinase [Streptococcus porcinus]|uniref:Carbamate kinase n=2 Tax=Streptococcus porcinus TaxID=1340 RepID=A0A4V0HEZ2_STRPO|nr:carbamate kinase [Streptococcus porcinus]EGJ26913.1 carbamate kinase [Streptococcus porcinus str. Jelinkova 176]SQG48513.1 carbamate kinase [Streptococcus porcinus]VTT46728.1 carbamate kinase [Streptococcus porcinus]VTT47751.1 carbamate kinase [Streptococcus porcinus]